MERVSLKKCCKLLYAKDKAASPVFISVRGTVLALKENMKAAFTTWKNRIAPVFDVAGEVVLVEADRNTHVGSTVMSLPEGAVETKVKRLCEQGVNVLVCGAMSRCAHELVCAERIDVFSFVAGDTDSVINAWLEGCLEQKAFAMPGCIHGRRRRCRFRGGDK